MTLRLGSLFSGVGGLELGLEWAGMGPTVWQVESDEYCSRVLAKHWPDAARYGDIREVDFAELTPVDLICGGFPCQDISIAGRREGIGGERSGLWADFARAVRDLRPRWVVVENVANLTVRGLDRVLADLAALGYDAEWEGLPAAAVGAPHIRDRLYLLAYPSGGRHGAPDEAVLPRRESAELSRGWTPEPPVARVDDGLPGRVDRCRVLGNAVVPQVAQFVGEQIMEAERRKVTA